MSYSKTIIVGNLTADPEVKDAGNSKVTDFTVAVTRNWKNKDGEKQEETSFIDVVAWGSLGEKLIAEYFKKGDEILVEGHLKQESWEDKETGKKRSTLRLVADDIAFTRGGTKKSPTE